MVINNMITGNAGVADVPVWIWLVGIATVVMLVGTAFMLYKILSDKNGKVRYTSRTTRASFGSSQDGGFSRNLQGFSRPYDNSNINSPFASSVQNVQRQTNLQLPEGTHSNSHLGRSAVRNPYAQLPHQKVEMQSSAPYRGKYNFGRQNYDTDSSDMHTQSNIHAPYDELFELTKERYDTNKSNVHARYQMTDHKNK